MKKKLLTVTASVLIAVLLTVSCSKNSGDERDNLISDTTVENGSDSDSGTDGSIDTSQDTAVSGTEIDSFSDSETGTESDTGIPPFITGFFVQPQLGYGVTDPSLFSSQAEYDAFVKTMSDAGADTLIYQWTTHYWYNQTWFSDTYGGDASGDFAFYNADSNTISGISARGWVTPTLWPGSPNDGGKEPVEYILDAAEANSINIILGLYLCEDSNGYNWWNAISDNIITKEDRDIINYHVERSIVIVNELYSKYKQKTALKGFYLSVEIANIAFIPEANWPILADLLDRVADAVHQNDPALTLSISPFFNTKLSTSEEYGAMWNYALANSDLDIIILQDGVGVEPETLTESEDKISPFFIEVAKAAKNNKKQFWANSELFTNTGTRENPAFEPATIEKIELQLKTEAQYTTKLVSFDFHYMDPNPNYNFNPPLTDDAAKRAALYKSYSQYLK
ncbi:MAG: DUF4434 domain-containing protein [Deltaproteobacteria bacterium]|nr:DUF4434 domain-containing protein [Deltaproteobacteria bacterium]